MIPAGAISGTERPDPPLRTVFMRWQCRARQMAMRDTEGRPDDAVTPAVYLPDADAPLGHVITLINKAPGYSVTPEFKHMARKTNDPAQRREQAVRFLSASHYQRAGEFSDTLTATFRPDSPGAAKLREAGEARLVFDAYARIFDLVCKVRRLAERDPLHQSTIAHNSLFNPALAPDTVVLGFEPVWRRSSSNHSGGDAA